MSSLVLARRFLHRRISPWRRGALTQADVAGDPPESCVRIAINSDPRCRGRAKTIHVFSRDDNWQKSIIFPYRGGRGKLSFILISVSGNGLAKRAHRLLYSGTSSIDKCTCLVKASCVCVCVSDRLRARAHDYYFARNSSRRANDNLRNVNAAPRTIRRWKDIISKYI